MTAINLLGGPQEFAEFKFGTRHAKLYFDDDLTAKINKTRLSISKQLHDLNKEKLSKLDDKSVEEQRKFLDKLQKDLRQELINFFDEQFGEGAGEELYKLTHKSTEHMASALFMITKGYDDLQERRNSYINTYYKSRRATKKK